MTRRKEGRRTPHPIVRAALAQIATGLDAAFRWLRVALAGAVLAMQREHALETRGLYARIRHPGPLGAWLAALPLVAAVALLRWALAGGEEVMLERRFGYAHRSYRACSGRFLPRLTPPRRPG